MMKPFLRRVKPRYLKVSNSTHFAVRPIFNSSWYRYRKKNQSLSLASLNERQLKRCQGFYSVWVLSSYSPLVRLVLSFFLFILFTTYYTEQKAMQDRRSGTRKIHWWARAFKIPQRLDARIRKIVAQCPPFMTGTGNQPLRRYVVLGMYIFKKPSQMGARI